MVSYITSLTASQRLGASGGPALEIKLSTSNGIYTSLISIRGTGNEHVVHSFSDNQEHLSQALHNIDNVIAPLLIKEKFDLGQDLNKIDRFLKELAASETGASSYRLGHQEMMGISIACSRAGAACAGLPLYEFLRQKAPAAKAPYIMPVPFFTVLDSDGLEYSIAPVGASNMTDAIRMGSETYRCLREALEEKLGAAATHTTSSGSFSLPLIPHLEALHLLATAIHTAGYTGKISMGINAASATLNTPEKLNIYHDIMTKYPIALLEDPFPEDEWQSWMHVMSEKGREEGAWKYVEIVDCETMAHKRMQEARAKGVCNGIRISLDQFPTLSEVFATANQAFSYDWGVFISHSHLETNDSFIADLAVALRSGHIKTGAPTRGENVVKYNRLLEIFDEIKDSREDVEFAGSQFRTANGRVEGGKIPLNLYGY
ncbi:uncharacterized protein BP5553_04558 [Venustampulla echinocandica]|uniref:phosphopyruvate hydratase n=1 Tax=Venustampulla echinocandica TaxID=2656787 RepID=A0A370TNM5_9HELO|nr:uncharacterized protein BP5553_04558 [Venustampulla echinocandica]RDL37125.1 hypothetical protein BP5553_04558 [Venustampulla echinocandica]